MSDKSAIEWTDATWNPTTGCTKVSPGCAHCYIERTPAFRIAGRRFVHGAIPLQLHPDRLDHPLHWKRPRRVFVNSLSDLFHPDVPATFIADVFARMRATPQHTYQVLTKRPERMLELFRNPPADAPKPWPLPNVWLGVSVENQHFADERIPLLLQTPAAVRWVSAEPLLGPVDFSKYLGRPRKVCEHCGCRVAFDNQVGKDRGKQRGAVARTVDLPDTYSLPAFATSDAVVSAPSNVATYSSREPIHDGRRGAVNSEAGAVCTAGPSTPVQVPFTIEQSGDVTENGSVGWNGNRLGAQARTCAPRGDTELPETSLHGRTTCSESNRERVNRGALFVPGDQVCACNYHGLHEHHFINWIVCGGESGPGARPFDLAWARSILAQCQAAGVACFVKQLGTWPRTIEFPNDVTVNGFPLHEQPAMIGDRLCLHDKKGGDPAEWPADLRVREYPV